MDSGQMATLYDSLYYEHNCGLPYERSEPWLSSFQAMAEQLINDLQPRTVLDAGCAMGFLVEALRDRGVEAWGLDISEYAINQVRPDIRPYCRVGSLTEPLSQQYDVIVCIEVLEHLTPQEGEQVVENLCRHTDDILFSSTPFDFKEVTHVNVQPPDYWIELFARKGFFRDVDFQVNYLPLWGLRFRRLRESPTRVVAAYERRLWQLQQERQGRLELTLQQQHSLSQKEAENRALREQVDAQQQRSQQLVPQLGEQQQNIKELVSQLAEQKHTIQELRSQLGEQKQTIQGLEAQVEEREQAVQKLGTELSLVTGSRGWALLQQLWRLRRWLVPRDSRRARIARLGVLSLRVWRAEGGGAVARKAARKLGLSGNGTAASDIVESAGQPAGPEFYQTWIAENDPSEAELEQQRQQAKQFADQPLISIITPTYNTPPELLQATIESLTKQTYERWELCVADGDSTSEGTKQLLQEWAKRDPRVVVKFLERNLGISGNSNEALALARGEFIALLDHDDLLPPHALFEVVKLLNEKPETDFIYTDKDQVSEDGKRRFDPLFKPDWSPEIMLSANYLTHLCVARKALVDKVGGFKPEVDGAQDWDFFLRLTEASDKIAHLPKVLYHWRVWANSVSTGIAAKPYALQAQQRSIQEHLERQGIEGRADFNEHGWLRVTWPVTNRTKVSIIIATGGRAEALRPCLHALLTNTTYQNFEVLLVHSGPRSRATERSYQALTADSRVRLLYYDRPFNRSAVNNFGVAASQGEALLFLNENLAAVNPDWLEELVRWIERPEIGAVGGNLLRTDGMLEQGGLIVGLKGLASGLFAGVPPLHYGIYGSVGWYRNYLAVSGDCLMIRRALFEEAGRFNEELISYGSDLALCLQVVERGHRVVYTPFATLQRQQAAADRSEPGRVDFEKVYKSCLPVLENGDPFYNPNLSAWSALPDLKLGVEESPQQFVARCLREGKSLSVNGHRPKSPKATPQMSTAPSINTEAGYLVSQLDFTTAELEASKQLQAASPGRLEIRSINWFLPSFTYAYYGGIYTILRFADYLRRANGVESRFVVVDNVPADQIKTAITNAFPNLAEAEVKSLAGPTDLVGLSPADATICSLWTTAYYALKFNRTRRKFYFIQDCEPLFYAASSTSAQVEATYRFGFYGLANTQSLKEIYEQEYGGVAQSFTPCVDTHIFQPSSQAKRGAPFKVFFYGRPGHLRNGFELGATALHKLKTRLGNRVMIYSAGAKWEPAEYGLEGVVENLGLLSYEQTAELYRTCDVGLVMMFTKHPSYLPFELMASGALVVSNYNPATTWFLKDKENCLLSEPSSSCLASTIEAGLLDIELRRRIVETAVQNIRANYASWDRQLGHIYDFMCDPVASQQDFA